MDSNDLACAKRRRTSLKVFMQEQDLSASEMARQAGLPSANAIYNFLNGRSTQLSQTTYEKLAQVVPGTTIDRLTGLGTLMKSRPAREIKRMIKGVNQKLRQQAAGSKGCSYSLGYRDGLCDALNELTKP